MSIGLFCRPLVLKNPNFCIFWTSAFTDVDSWWQSEKVEHGCTTANLPLSNGIKIVSVLQRLYGEIGHTNSDIQKRDRQTKNSAFFAAPAAGQIRAILYLMLMRQRLFFHCSLIIDLRYFQLFTHFMLYLTTLKV